jgi:hypothetical protein
LRIAFAGLAARRGDPVSGETRAKKLRQCWRTRRSWFFGKLTGNVLHADQYTRAACDSISRIVVMLSAAGNSALNCKIESAVEVSSSLWRATCSLSGELLNDQFARDSQRGPRWVREGLGAAQLRIRGTDRARDSEHLAIAFKHDERRVLIGEPAKRCERDDSPWADHDQAAKAMSDAREPGVAAIRADPVFQKQVTAINTELDAVTEQGDDPMSRHD